MSLILLSSIITYAQLKAFPSAYGAGAFTTGGRGGQVIHVTSLADSGPGTLRDALENHQGITRYIVFDVSGAIQLQSKIEVTKSQGYVGNYTVNGFSAPRGGITITGYPIVQVELENYIWRGIRFRNGYKNEVNGQWSNQTELQNRGSKNFIIDRCSFAFARSKGTGGGSPNNIDGTVGVLSIQNCLFGESEQAIITGNSNAALSSDVSILRNVMSNVGWRHPKGGGEINLDVINNLTHNWRNRIIRMDAWNFNLNLIGNYYQGGQDTQDSNNPEIVFTMWTSNSISPQIWDDDNYVDPQFRPTNYPAEPWQAWDPFASSSAPVRQEWFVNSILPLQGEAPEILASSELMNVLLPKVGACEYIDDNATVQFYRDDVDTDLIDKIITDSNVSVLPESAYESAANASIVGMPSETRPGNFYQSNPHIPEIWFQANVPNGQDHNDIAPSGYTWLEEYLYMIDSTGTSGQQVYAGEDVAICNGESITLTATGADTYEWSTGETTASITVSPTTTQTYTVIGTHPDDSTSTDAVVVTVNEIPEADAGPDETICFGSSIVLTASGGDTYLWSTGETTASITVSPGATTSYEVTVSSNGCEDTDNVTITVLPAPTADAGSDQEIPLGAFAVLTATGGDSFLWSTGETTAQISVNPIVTTLYTVTVFQDGCQDDDDVLVTVVQPVIADAGEDQQICIGDSAILTASGGDSYLWSTGETTQSITVNPSTDTVYTVEVSDQYTSDSDQVTVFVNDLPVANAGVDQTICNGDTATLTASGGDTYLWSTGETSATIQVSPTDTSTYTVTVFQNGCEAQDDVLVTVNPLPNAFAGNDIMVMQGETVTLTASGGGTYLWSTGETTQSIVVGPNVTTTYTVTVNVNGCQDSDDVTVIVMDEIIANAGEDQTICEGESVVLTASGGNTYVWSTGETTQSITVSPIEDTVYTVTAIIGSATDSDDVTVFVNPAPDAEAGEDVTINEGDATVLTASGGDTYEWSTGETTASITVSPVEDTTYTVFVTQNGCDNFDEVTVFVNPAANADAGEDETICQGSEVVLTATGGDTYVWSTGATTQSITVAPMATSNYSVIVSNDFSSDTDEVTVFVNPLPDVQVSGDVAIMQGEFVTLSASGANTYEWSNGATLPNIAVSPSETTTYSVTGFINNCSETESVTVSVFEEVVADAGTDMSICFGDSVTLTANGGDSFVWSTGETTQSIEVNPTEDTVYTVIVSNALDSDTDEVLVTVANCVIDDSIDEEVSYDYEVFLTQNNSDELNIRLSGLEGDVSVQIHDLTGKLLYQERFNDNNGQPFVRQLNISNYAKTTYFITLEEQNRRTTKQVIFH